MPLIEQSCKSLSESRRYPPSHLTYIQSYHLIEPATGKISIPRTCTRDWGTRTTTTHERLGILSSFSSVAPLVHSFLRFEREREPLSPTPDICIKKQCLGDCILRSMRYVRISEKIKTLSVLTQFPLGRPIDGYITPGPKNSNCLQHFFTFSPGMFTFRDAR